MRIQNGSIVIAPPVTNPAMSCPDMSAWKLFAQVVTQEFWKGWAADEYTWPQSQPLRLCQSGEDPIKANCCQPGSKNNPGYDDLQNPAKFCPYFPGDFLSRYKEGAPLRFGREPSKAHLRTSGGEPVQKLLANGDPGREIRQSMAELVFRNKPMFDFVFKKNLYNQEGIAGVFTRNSANVSKGTAFHVQNTGGATVEIAFPADAIMIKSNWLNRERAEQIGLKEDPKNPYIKMNILTPVTDNNGTILKPGEHWLLAFHISSKDTPNWVWTTFEHVNNLGRCDYTGCNDSFGYRSPDKVSAGQASNFTMPHLKCDDLLLPSWIYDTGKTYAGGDITPALQSVFNGLGIGTKDNPTLVPTRYDRAWKSYRIKGSQTEFTDSTGQPTHLGNSVTEAGFVSTSSCITCHSRAGTTAKGTIPLALGVFVNELNDMGYAQSAFGVPNPAWFTASQQPPALTSPTLSEGVGRLSPAQQRSLFGHIIVGRLVVRLQEGPDAFDVDLGFSCPLGGRAIAAATVGSLHVEQEVSPLLEHPQGNPECLFDLRRLFGQEDGCGKGVAGMAAESEGFVFLDAPQDAAATGAVEWHLFPERLDRMQVAQDSLCDLRLDGDVFGHGLTLAELPPDELGQKSAHLRQRQAIVDLHAIEGILRHVGVGCVLRVLHNASPPAPLDRCQAGGSIIQIAGEQHTDHSVSIGHGG
ncbi:MAG TPA: hypothetical protein VD972_23725 [Hyalangium sp.]|nr:hypothetical protein [Hyalangium sp.]HYH98984.1 hypothetical protein [Hyalangium sp.]